MANKGTVTLTRNRIGLLGVKSAIAGSVAQVFEADIKSDAQEKSPVDTGTNRRSITTQTEENDKGVQAEIFTQSGYGGYLELGHRVKGDSGKIVQGQPYIYPAVIKNVPTLVAICKKDIKAKGGK